MPATADNDAQTGQGCASRTDRGGRATRSFTLVEMLVAMAVFFIIAAIIATMIAQTQRATIRALGQGQSFQQARSAFELLTRRLSEATLNTYWDYQTNSNGVCTNYFRNSNLEFVTGQTAVLLSTNASYCPTHAVFFQAPLGYSTNSTSTAGTEGLNNLLNACGFAIMFGSDTPAIPSFMQTTFNVQGSYRYRLYQWLEPAEKLQIYSSSSGMAWFQTPIGTSTDAIQSISANVIALILLPRESVLQDSTGTALTTDYTYDTRLPVGTGTPTSSLTYNQLPPEVDVILVAIDEASARRLAQQFGTAPPNFGLPAGIFTQVVNLAADLQTLQTKLQSMHVNYRVFRSTVKIPGAKWSSY